MRRVLLALSALLLFAPAASASTTIGPQLTKAQVESAFLADGKVAHWMKHYPRSSLGAEMIFEPAGQSWRVYVGSETAGVIADGRVSDDTGLVTEAWTGPQVYWTMARGYRGVFGGRWLNSWPVWLGFCLVFVLGLADWRRLRSLRNLDLLVLLSFSVSLWYFNRGDVLTSVSLVYPPLLYLLGRCGWIGWRGRSPGASRPVWPVWLLVALTVLLMGFRVGLNVLDSNVIDVGYSSVIGAERISAHQSPYGHFPVSNNQVCGGPDSHGNTRGRLQDNGRCEVPQPQGDTYGPVAYEAYLPGYWIFGWSGQWDDLPAAHFTAILFDIVCVLLLALLGWRMAGSRLAATLAFAWAAYPFTQYASSSNANDVIPSAFLIAGLILVAFPLARGASVALSGWTKFASLLLVPLWASYPDGLSKPRAKAMFAAGFLAATLIAFLVLFLDPHPIHAVSVFYHRSIGFQLGRSSPFSIWDWRRQYHANLPDLQLVQRALEVLVVVAAIAVYFVPRRKTPLQLAALTGFLLLGLELVMTHWFYLYIPWFFPFAAVAILAPRLGPTPETEAELADGA